MIMQNIFEAMSGKTVIAAQSNDDDLSAFDLVMTFEGAKLTGTEHRGGAEAASPEEREPAPQTAPAPQEAVK